MKPLPKPRENADIPNQDGFKLTALLRVRGLPTRDLKVVREASGCHALYIDEPGETSERFDINQVAHWLPRE